MTRTAPSPWERLIAIATLGTRRAPLTGETLWPDPSLAPPALRTPSSEITLLRAAAATWLWEIAGRRAGAQNESGPRPVFGQPLSEGEGREKADSLPNVADRMVVKEEAAWRLGRMIDGEYRDLIPEWFTLAQQARKSLPPHWLPVILEGVAPEIRNAYPDVLGPAASWLAARNPDWTVVSMTGKPEQRWHEGTFEERRAALTAMRMHDASEARRWVQSTWAADPADARETFLQIMRIGLSVEDEPFLEAALDDRRKGVRLQAAECLARLPDSQLARRHSSRLEPLVVLEEQKSGVLAKLRKRKLQIELPAALDKAAIRDGIEPRPPAQRKIGERAFWLTQLISMVPPRHWSDRFGCDASAFLAAAMDTEYAGELLPALSTATERHPDREWISVLARSWIQSKNETLAIAQAIASLIGAAGPDERPALLESLLSGKGLDANIVFYLLSSIALAWPPSITRLALQNLEARVRTDSQQWSHPRNALDEWGRRCDVQASAGELPRIVAACDERSPWRNALDQMNAVVDFRSAMRMELST